MPGAEPERLVEDHRGGDLLVVLPGVDLPPVVDEGVLQDHSLGQEERESGALLHDGEQAELLAELAVVPLLGLLQHGEILVEVLLALPCGPVDPGEHLVVLVAPPVRAGDGGELEGLDRLGVEAVGSGAEVHELALLVEADGGVLREVLHEHDLVVLAPSLEVVDGLLPGQGVGLDLEVLLDDLLHLGLERVEVLGGEPSLPVEVVVEPVVDGGADGQLGAGEQPEHGLCQHVCCRVPDYGERVLGLLDRSVGVERLHEIISAPLHGGKRTPLCLGPLITTRARNPIQPP